MPSVEFDATVRACVNGGKNNWEKLLDIVSEVECEERRRLTWVWPTADNLNELRDLLRKLRVQRILSIGCGAGLLEWLFTASLGVEIFGLEVDKRWWQSKYAADSFIPTSYIDEQDVTIPATLQTCCHSNDWSFALLFCYFNNRVAFLDYLKIFHGNWIIIIGPRPDAGVHTDPSPLDPQFPMLSTLTAQLYIDDHDIVTIYEINANKNH